MFFGEGEVWRLLGLPSSKGWRSFLEGFSCRFGSVISDFARCDLKGTFPFISDYSAPPSISPLNFCLKLSLSSPPSSCKFLPTCVVCLFPAPFCWAFPSPAGSLSIHSYLSTLSCMFCALQHSPHPHLKPTPWGIHQFGVSVWPGGDFWSWQ